MSKIKKIEVFFLEYSFPKKLNYKYSAGVVENMIVPVVKLTDINNNYGLGEVTHGQFTYEPIIGLTKHFSNLLKNTNSENINEAWEKMYGSSVFWNREGLGIGVMGGINIAMYDLLGKRMKVPVYKLLGGIQKEKIRIYASNGLFDNSKQLLEDAAKAYSLGFRVYKMRVIDPDSTINLVKSFNKKFKNKMQLIVDAVQGSAANPWGTKVSINLAKKLEKEEIIFLEEPFRVENLKGYKDIKKNTLLNIAGAESIPTGRAFKNARVPTAKMGQDLYVGNRTKYAGFAINAPGQTLPNLKNKQVTYAEHSKEHKITATSVNWYNVYTLGGLINKDIDKAFKKVGFK